MTWLASLMCGRNPEGEDIMSTAFESIKQGLQEAIAHAKGDARGVRVHLPRTIDVKAVRVKVGMTQERFAARFGFSMATLRHWERGDRTPRGPALVLLKVIERNPQAVSRPWCDYLAKGCSKVGTGAGTE